MQAQIYSNMLLKLNYAFHCGTYSKNTHVEVARITEHAERQRSQLRATARFWTVIEP